MLVHCHNWPQIPALFPQLPGETIRYPYNLKKNA
jgi:hypothetical protein